MDFGGSEVHTLALMRALIERGYQIELIANRYHGYDPFVLEYGWKDSVRIVHTDLDGILYGERSDRAGWREVFTHLRSDVMFFVKGNNNYGQVGFLRECRRAFKRILFIEHLEPRERPNRSLRELVRLKGGIGVWWYKRMVLSRIGAGYADAIVVVSEMLRNRLLTDLHYPANKLIVIRNGVPFREFAYSDERRRAARAVHGLPEEAFVFGMLGRLSAVKGMDLAIRALGRVVQQSPATPALLVIAGEGSELESLTRLASSLGLQDRVRFIGFVRDPEVVVSAFDVILFASRAEGLPLGLLQGMAAGCIPIVTRISGMPEAVSSPEIGWVVMPESPDALAEAMQSAMALGPDRIAAMRRHVVDTVRGHFDIEEANKAFVQLCKV